MNKIPTTPETPVFAHPNESNLVIRGLDKIIQLSIKLEVPKLARTSLDAHFNMGIDTNWNVPKSTLIKGLLPEASRTSPSSTASESNILDNIVKPHNLLKLILNYGMLLSTTKCCSAFVEPT